MRAARTAALFALLATACQPGAGSRSALDARTSIDRLYPMRAGSVWTYDVDAGDGPPALAITRVTTTGDGRVEISSGGAPIVYEPREDGLYRVDRRAYLLKLPLETGARWDAGDGATAEVLDTQKRVTTPAGDFSGCVEVRESGGETPKVVRTVFCPDVGPVEVESSMELSVSGRAARVLATLRGYDFSGAFSAP